MTAQASGRRGVPAVAGAPRRNPWKKVLGRSQFRVGLVVLLITFGWYGIFVFGPVIRGFTLALQDFQLLDPASSPWVGFKNFEMWLTYDRFWEAVQNTLIYAGVSYVVSIPLALLIAWAISSVVRGRRIYEFTVFLPVVVSLVAIAMIFRMLMHPDFGMLNNILSSVGLPTSNWIFGQESALMAVILLDIWKGLGFHVVLLSAAMLAVSSDLIEAARLDGASGWQIFRNVTLPSITPTLALCSILIVHGGLGVYVTPVVLGPGPGSSTLMMNQLIVDTAFVSFEMSLAAAGSVILFVVVVLLTALQLRIARPPKDS